MSESTMAAAAAAAPPAPRFVAYRARLAAITAEIAALVEEYNDVGGRRREHRAAAERAQYAAERTAEERNRSVWTYGYTTLPDDGRFRPGHTMGMADLERRAAERAVDEELTAELDRINGRIVALHREQTDLETNATSQNWFSDADEVPVGGLRVDVPLGVYRWDIGAVYRANRDTVRTDEYGVSQPFDEEFVKAWGYLWDIEDREATTMPAEVGYCVLARRAEHYEVYTRNVHLRVDAAFVQRWTAVYVDPDTLLPSKLLLSPVGRDLGRYRNPAVPRVLTDARYYHELARADVGEDTLMSLFRRWANGHRGQGDPGHSLASEGYLGTTRDYAATLRAFAASDILRRFTMVMSVKRLDHDPAPGYRNDRLPRIPDVSGGNTELIELARTATPMLSAGPARWVPSAF